MLNSYERIFQMTIYIILFALAVGLGLIMLGKNPTSLKKTVYLSIMFVLLYLTSVFRYGMGNDYFSYIRIFKEISAADWSIVVSGKYEPIYALITKLIATFTQSPEIMYAIFAALILIPVAYAIKKYSDNVWLSVTVYLCFTFFYTSLSFIRQSLAVSVIILAYGFMKKRKFVPVIILGIIAVLIHYTSAVFIVFYLLTLIKPTKKYLIIYGSVSLGSLIICLIMKALGANPLNLIAQLFSAILGKDYSSYIGTIWFETGFGFEYLVMPLILLAFVLISYFCGWKERPEADMLLQATLLNATIWSFIVYAFIIERFSMFIFIFSIFTVPSITSYFSEKAALAEKKEAPDKKMPGYSKKKAEDKKDNAFLIIVCTTVGLFAYNCFGLIRNFHGVTPYMTIFPEIQDAIDGYDTPEENRDVMYTNADLYTYLIQLKNADCGYAIVSTTENYSGFTPGILRAADYAGTGLAKMYDNPVADYEETNVDSITVERSGKEASVTDSFGNTAKIPEDVIGFVLLDENGKIFDGSWYDVHEVKRNAAKLEISYVGEESKVTGE